MKIYTGTGDRGRTSLFSGERVGKDHLQVEAYGCLDELSAALGLVASSLPEACGREDAETVHRIQSDLLDVGAVLAVLPERLEDMNTAPVAAARADFLEAAMDRLDAQLPALRAFILPGGSLPASFCHLARTICRRSERRLVSLADHAGKDAQNSPYDGPLVYLNRLSDYLFVLARWCNHCMEQAETTWSPRND